MLYLGGIDGLIDIRGQFKVTAFTELLGGGNKLKPGIRTMGIVTGTAIFEGWFMGVLHVKLILNAIMAFETELSLFQRRDEQFLIG